MKSKIKLIALWTTAALLVAVICLIFAACGETETPPDEEDPGELTVTSLTVARAPVKTNYFAGEKFDPSGMVLRAVFSNDSKKTVLPAAFDYSPKDALTVGTTLITITYMGASVEQQISVSEIFSLFVDRSGVPVRVPNGKVDLSGISVTANGSDDDVDGIIVDDYTVKLDGTLLRDPSAAELTTGKHTVTVEYGGKSASFEVEAFNGYIVEADTLYSTAKIPDGAKNFVELVKAGAKTPMIVEKASEPASGGKYLGNIAKNTELTFHIWSEFDASVEIRLTAASGMLLEGTWTAPVKMGDMQFNKLFEIQTGTADDLKPLTVGDDVVLQGGSASSGDNRLWVNWKDVNFGEMKLKAGDNLIKFKVISDYKNAVYNESCACNIDKIEVLFKD